jgi:hypothetical protein
MMVDMGFLLQVTRWFEPFIEYGPDCSRSAPFYDATIVLGRRARDLLSREGVEEPEVSRRADCVNALLPSPRALASYTNPVFSFYSAYASFGLID